MRTRTSIHSILLILTGGLLMILSSCSEDFFNKQAGDRITPDQHYQDITDGEVSLAGAIVTLQEAMPRMILLDGLRSDQMEVTMAADQYFREIYEHNISEFNPYTSSADLYKVIINLNETLAHLDELAANERELDEYTTYYVRGEILAMRAWTYFQIARLYGEVIYHPDNLETLPDNLGETMSKDVIIDTLINQLIPYIYDPTAGIEKQEINFELYVNPKAILGEMYLEKGDYAEAIRYLKMACESYSNSGFKVDRTYSENAWYTMFLNASSASTEHFSVMPFSASDHQLNPLARWMGYNYDYLLRPTQVLVDSFEAQVSLQSYFGDYFRGNGFIPTGITYGVDTLSKSSETDFEVAYYISKYEMDPSDPFSTDIVLQRAADIHLLLAEAYNRMGDEDSEHLALMLLNAGANAELPKPEGYSRWSSNVGVRGRAKLEARVIPDNIIGQARTELIEDLILQERSMELAFEGKRWFDLVRVAERRNDDNYVADRVAAKFEGTPMHDQIHTRLQNRDNWYLEFK